MLLISYLKFVAVLAMDLLPTTHGKSKSDPIDKMFEAYIGHSFRESQDAHRTRRDRFVMLNTSAHLVAHLIYNGTLVDTPTPPNDPSTTENPMKILATLAPNETKTETYSQKDFLQRRKLRQLEEIIRSPSIMQEYLNQDDFETLTRRFDAIPLTRRVKYYHKPPRKPGKTWEEWRIKERQKEHYKVKQSWKWNYDYPYFMNGYKYTLEKNKTLQIMHSIVHEVRYKLVYPQLLRKKYHKSIRYRLGYLFAMLRHLQRQARLIYHEIENMIQIYITLYYPMRLLDKISRLATDVKDVIKLIRQYEFQRKLVEEPQYYDSYPSSTLPKWRRDLKKMKNRRNLTMEEIKVIKRKIELEKLKLKI